MRKFNLKFFFKTLVGFSIYLSNQKFVCEENTIKFLNKLITLEFKKIQFNKRKPILICQLLLQCLMNLINQ